MRTIGITGGTGFVGQHLTRLLTQGGNHVVIFTRKPEKARNTDKVTYCYWNPAENKCDLTCLGKLDAVVNLAGAGIADKRWTKKRKEEIVTSRVASTNFLVAQLRRHAPQCKTLVSASAIGYYGPDRTGKPFRESDLAYNDFLGSTCRKWEQAAQQGAKDMRVVLLRFGIVLGKEDGAFKQLARPLSFGIMPVLGNGQQKVSWIHVKDLAQLISHAIEDQSMKGVYNAVAPEPVTHKALMETIAQEKGGASFGVPVPAFALKLMLGEMSTEVLKSSTVSAQKLKDTGFRFSYPDIRVAVRSLLDNSSFIPVPAQL